MKNLTRICALSFLFLLLTGPVVAEGQGIVKSHSVGSKQRTVLSQMAAHYAPIEARWFNMRATAWGYAISAENQEIVGSRSNYSGDQHSEEYPFFFVGR